MSAASACTATSEARASHSDKICGRQRPRRLRAHSSEVAKQRPVRVEKMRPMHGFGPACDSTKSETGPEGTRRVGPAWEYASAAMPGPTLVASADEDSEIERSSRISLVIIVLFL